MSARCTGRITCGAFEVESYGRGWAYRIAAEDGRTAWVQDEDAVRLREDSGDFDDPEALRDLIDAIGSIEV